LYLKLWQDAAHQLPLVVQKLTKIEQLREQEKKQKQTKKEPEKPKPKKAVVGGTTYIDFVKKYAKKHGLGFKEAMKKASKSYQRQK